MTDPQPHSPVDVLDFLTLREAATRLQLSEATVRRYIRDGILPASRLGRRDLRINPTDLRALFQPAQ